MRQTGSEQDYLLCFPLVLPPFDEPQRLFILAQGRFNQGAAVVGIASAVGSRSGTVVSRTA